MKAQEILNQFCDDCGIDNHDYSYDFYALDFIDDHDLQEQFREYLQYIKEEHFDPKNR